VSDIILKVENLTKEFKVHKTGGIGGASGRSHALVRAVSDVSFSVTKGETFGIVGESGCGKSTTGRLILRLIDPTSGRIEFRGADITPSLREKPCAGIRRKIQMVFPGSLCVPQSTHEYRGQRGRAADDSQAGVEQYRTG